MVRLSDKQFYGLWALSRLPKATFSDLPRVGETTVRMLVQRGLAHVSIEITPEGRKALEEYLA